MAKKKSTSPDERSRCLWGSCEPMLTYHDAEWGVPLHDEHGLFEFLILEGAQAGLSWATILAKRENYRAAFAQFDPVKCAKFTAKQEAACLQNEGLVRNRLKIASVAINARAFLAVQSEFGTFDKFIWQFVEGEPLQPGRKSIQDVPAKTTESDAMSKELKRRGFKFIGSTICYAFMQATGMVNDHVASCFRHAELS
ncbi:DNA-3-methyladenine glycosylase I [Anatilimnocola floriformis]|uniref:DNA-3-methyladenine glycosylase I n=1 Tax=Anatilimnocola floriformis TaxID=2948575 RepID=UPI0020C258AB|nr:DNA-3-methyladenine glycosylase I [Anatilimnocola floriformis]